MVMLDTGQSTIFMLFGGPEKDRHALPSKLRGGGLRVENHDLQAPTLNTDLSARGIGL